MYYLHAYSPDVNLVLQPLAWRQPPRTAVNERGASGVRPQRTLKLSADPPILITSPGNRLVCVLGTRTHERLYDPTVGACNRFKTV